MGVMHRTGGTVFSALHCLAYLTVGITEGNSLKHKPVDILDRKDIIIAIFIKNVISDTNVPEHEFGHIKTLNHIGYGREEDIFHQLQVAVIAQRKVGREQGEFVGNRLQTIAFSTHYLEYVGVLLVGHDARSGGEFIGERHESEIIAHPETHIHSKMAKRRGYR